MFPVYEQATEVFSISYDIIVSAWIKQHWMLRFVLQNKSTENENICL